MNLNLNGIGLGNGASTDGVTRQLVKLHTDESKSIFYNVGTDYGLLTGESWLANIDTSNTIYARTIFAISDYSNYNVIFNFRNIANSTRTFAVAVSNTGYIYLYLDGIITTTTKQVTLYKECEVYVLLKDSVATVYCDGELIHTYNIVTTTPFVVDQLSFNSLNGGSTYNATGYTRYLEFGSDIEMYERWDGFYAVNNIAVGENGGQLILTDGSPSGAISYNVLLDESSYNNYSLVTKAYSVVPVADAEIPVLHFTAGTGELITYVRSSNYVISDEYQEIVSSKFIHLTPIEIEWLFKLQNSTYVYFEYNVLNVTGGWVTATTTLQTINTGEICDLKIYVKTGWLKFDICGNIVEVATNATASVFTTLDVGTTNTSRDFSGVVTDLSIMDENVNILDAQISGPDWTTTNISDPDGNLFGYGITRTIYPNPMDNATLTGITGWTNASAFTLGEYKAEDNGTTIRTGDGFNTNVTGV